MQGLEADASCKSRHHADHLQVDGPLPDHALFPDLFPAGLKLRFNEAYHLAVRLHKGLHRPQDLGKGDKRYVNGDELDLVRDLLRGHIPDVGLFHADHPRVVPELPGQLSMAHIHRIDLHSPVLQHAVGEPAGGRSHVHADLLIQGHAEMGHGLLQL